MPLAAGTRLGPYEILSPLGAGGMGEVYRAKDSDLKRDVAIKVLPAALANDGEYMARFRREAEVLASLNHPNIAQIYGLQENAIVMEFVEGSNLQGPLSADETLRIAKQIGAALEAAHEKGVVHRDLKPANVKITPQGQAKVLDFGLAKTADAKQDYDGNSPTLTLQSTQAGMILGTAGYMAPEQAAGKPVDKRADIWAFGVVLFELLTGKLLFQGETISHTLAHVLTLEPDWSLLPQDTPAGLVNILKRCLVKDPLKRLRDIGDAWLLMDESAPAPPARKAFPGNERLIWIAVCVLCAAASAILLVRAPKEKPQVTRLSLLPPEGERFPNRRTYPAISPDGRRIAFAVGSGSSMATNDLWIQELNSSVARKAVERGYDPFWSPDGRFLAFFAGGKLRRFDIASGAIQTICDAPGGRGGSWNQDGVIVFAPEASGPLFRVPAAGGEPSAVTEVEKTSSAVISHRHPWFLPDGKHFIYLSRSAGEGSIHWGELGSKQHGRLIESTGAAAIYADPGFLLFLRRDTLMALPFDASSLKQTGEPFPVAEHVQFQPVHAKGDFAAANNGTLVYGSGSPPVAQLTWVDLSGRELGALGKPFSGGRFVISPDGKRVAQEAEDTETGIRSIWLIDAIRGTRTRLTTDRGNETSPVWSPDGQLVAYTAVRAGHPVIIAKPTSGTATEKILFQSPFTNTNASSWSRDGRWLFVNGFETSTSIWLVPALGEGKAGPFLSNGQIQQSYARFSPDGRWVAYESSESRPPGIYVQNFPGKTTKVLVSAASGGGIPQWGPDGKTLYYMNSDRHVMSVPVKTGDKFEAGVPQLVYQGRIGYNSGFEVSPDGKRLLVSLSLEENAPSSLNVVLNWQAVLKQ